MKYTISNPEINFSNMYFPIDPSYCFLNIKTDGYFWRKNVITKLDYISLEEGILKQHTYEANPKVEDDEFKLLTAVIPVLSEFDKIITFNGTAFVYPFLKNKSSAFGICYNIDKESLLDLYIMFKSLYHFLKLPSQRIQDYLNFLGYKCRENSTDIVGISELFPYLKFLQADIKSLCAKVQDNLAIFDFALNTPVPKKVSFAFEPFYLILEDGFGKISAKINQGSIKLFHTDYKNYEFLPLEGYAVHKTIASIIPRERRIPAKPESAYTNIKVSEKLLLNTGLQHQYLETVIKYLNTVLTSH